MDGTGQANAFSVRSQSAYCLSYQVVGLRSAPIQYQPESDMFKELEPFPPTPHPAGIAGIDCRRMPSITQRRLGVHRRTARCLFLTERMARLAQCAVTNEQRP